MNKEQQRFIAAVAAMQGLLAHPKFAKCSFLRLAEDSVGLADDLLYELEKTKKVTDEKEP
jgi:hypothetical protein